MSNWTLFSNHGHVLLFVSQQPEARLRDIAERVGITERAVQKIVRDLQDGGILSVSKHGRCNHYRVHGRKPLRHELEAHCSVSALVNLIHPDSSTHTEAEAPVDTVAILLEEKVVSKPEPKPAAPGKPEPEPKPPAKGKPTARRKGRKRDDKADKDQGSLF